jgi:hypothetical protein
MISKCGHGQQKEWKVVNVYRFHWPEQVLPKRRFPLTRIDNLVDSAAGCELMALLDYFSGYHQIWLRREDEKTSFISLFKTYCYLRMSEGLRNVGPTFCRMTKVALHDQVGRNALSYVDDIVVMSKKKATYISNLAETFTNMSEAWLKLNPKMHIWDHKGQSDRVFSLHEWHRSKPQLN